MIETPSGKNSETENFPVGSFLLKAELRPHVHAFYRFARAADDISDNPLLEPNVKVARLNKFAEILMGKS
ncbi:MAG: squalene/phytoene synthase family protein, partial [Alphaproteobacteria bacterium]|nr:squalene/phytoene synthase family protein [Alphaproteobacteria bacterium]